MSNNLEIVMDIDTLEIFDVIDLDETNHFDTGIDEDLPEEKEISSYDNLNKTCLGNRYHYKLSVPIWEVIENGIIHDLSPRNKHGTYPYYQHSRDGTWGHVKQLTQEEALWLTLDLNSELISYV